MSSQSEEDLRKLYEEAKKVVDDAKNSVIIENVKEKKWGR